MAIIIPLPLRVEALRDDERLTSVAYIGPKSRTERPGMTKIGTEVAHVIHDSDTIFKVKRSKVNLQRTGTYCGGLPPQLVIIKTAFSIMTDFSGHNSICS